MSKQSRKKALNRKRAALRKIEAAYSEDRYTDPELEARGATLHDSGPRPVPGPRMPGDPTHEREAALLTKGGTVQLPARRNRDGSFTVNPGTADEYIIRDPSSGFAAPGDRRQTYAPDVQGPKDLPGLRHHLVDRVNWLRMDNDRRLDAQRDALDLGQAQLWWVADDVVSLVSRSATTVPDDTTINDISLPAHAHGFAVFSQPVISFDGWGIVAVDWHPAQYIVLGAHPKPGSTKQDVYDDAGLPGIGSTVSGFRMTWWAAPDLGEGLSTEQMSDPFGREALTREIEMQEHRHGPRRIEASLTGRTWVPFGTTSWMADTSIDTDAPGAPRLFPQGDGDFDANDPRYIQGSEEAITMRKILASLWVISRSEKIVEKRDAPADRAERRRRDRAGFGNDPVQVVQLRPRPKTESEGDGEGEGREYHHRWIRSGHFRWQPYGPESKLRKLIYIEPTICGPEGLPLLEPKKVFKVA